MSVCEIEPGGREIIDGRYEVIEAIGHGGMGTVYRALQRPIDREVAVKVLRQSSGGEDSARAVRRFFKEAKAIASLHHPHIISLYDFGQTRPGDLFLVMELLPGRSLAEVLRCEGPMPLTRAALILDQVLDALQEAHRKQIVHRDLKPENIQIGRRGEREDFVTVLDFGIARQTALQGVPSTTTTIEVAGTPAYMSPEQILGTAVDPRTDLYAVGVLLFELVTGRVPFDSERSIDVYMAHLKEPAPRLRDYAPSAISSPGLQELIDRALAKAAVDRIPDAAAFRRALRAVAGLPGHPSVNVTTDRNRNTVGGAILTGQGFELVASVEPARTPGIDELMQQWALDIPQHGGTVRERRPGLIVASFPGSDEPHAAMRAALMMKQRTKATRLSTLRPVYIRVGIHRQPSLAAKLCEEAPRGGVVIGADCLTDAELGKDLHVEPAGEVRVRGHRQPVKMVQLISGR